MVSPCFSCVISIGAGFVDMYTFVESERLGNKRMFKMEVGGSGLSSDGGQNVLQKMLILVC